MASRKDPVARARGRKPAPVKKPFPAAMVGGSAAIVLILGFFIFYAATHVGLGAKGSPNNLRAKYDGIITSKGLSQNHIDGKFISYPDQASTPPDGGNHNSVPQSCQVYTEAIANEHAVHSLEHGAAWITYDPDKVKGTDLAALKKLVEGDSYRMMSPYPGLKKPISIQVWGERIYFTKATDSTIAKFLGDWTQGPTTPEVGAACVGSTDTKKTADATFSGTASANGKPAGAVSPTPGPSGSATATPAATASATVTPAAAPSATPTAK
jgi:hypothetical protein